ncbi:Reverse transcriptase domain, partial [Trinorchestia longiramus]
MTTIISDRSKFQLISEPIHNYALKIEDKINNFLRKLKDLKMLSAENYSKMFVSGLGPGKLYGLPKTHKNNFSTMFQFRPIFAAYNTPGFSVAKFLVPVLNPISRNEFTLENSHSFVNDLSRISNATNCFMTSFDIENLFTNMPLEETLDICLLQLFTDPNSLVMGLSRKIFKTLLDLAVKYSFFLFNGKFYKQIGGLGMGLPLGPTFANIFMCFNETKWLKLCPTEFQPVFYRRYIDVTFFLFREKSHAALFFDFIYSKHPNIRFTME